jgi:magnesium chelatase subunit I
MSSNQPEPHPRPANLGALRAAGYRSRTVKQEMRANLLRHIADDAPVFEAIAGYQSSVIPAIQNAIVAGQDIVLLGERGQAKTRLARSLVSLMDEVVPVVAGTELREDPFAPIATNTPEHRGQG